MMPTVINAFKQIAADPAKSKELLNLFQSAPNEKISYKKLKDYLNDTLKLDL